MAASPPRFVWYDLVTPDPDAARRFYPAVTGWGIGEPPAADEPGYTTWTADGRPLGGVAELPAAAVEAGAGAHWLPYVAVADVDATATRVRDRGGRLRQEPADLPGGMGRYALALDPQGAPFALFHPGSREGVGGDEGEGGAPEGAVAWHELATRDADAAWSFYADLFGWDSDGVRELGGGMRYHTFSSGGSPLGGLYANDDVPPQWILYFGAADVDTASQAVGPAGGQLLHGPMDTPMGDRIAICADPQGAMFGLHRPG